MPVSTNLASSPASTSSISVACLGRKGILTLLEAARACGVELKVIGDGPERSAVQALVETSPRIELHHHMDGAELREHIRHARAVVLPSEWYENAPLSLLEAFACGKPVIGRADRRHTRARDGE